ncbi:MAG: FAD-binding oxidoreductase [Anaerolineae bacterium]|nr:FAD-binding oxidoreductase [Anaerolineae bacterium]
MKNEYQPLTATLLDTLATIVGPDNLSTAEADRSQRAFDVSSHTPRLSDVVVWPQTADQVAAVLKFANEQQIPVTAWGAGTSVEGNPIPLFGGILLSTEKMNAVIQVHADDLQVTVEAGKKYKELNQELEPLGLFFPPDPGGDATIGGMLANNAAGPKAVKYGACKDNVLRCQVALADGRIIQVGSRSIKQSSGYDLLHLFVGSEGTLGVITEATLKLLPLPKYVSAVVASFDAVGAAVQAVVKIKGGGLDPAALEFIDAQTIAMINTVGGLSLDHNHTLFMEFHATHESALHLGLERVKQICTELGARTFTATTDPAERKKLWYGRHHAYDYAQEYYVDKKLLTLDAAIPISHYPAIVEQIEQSLSKHNVAGHMLGHAGDGNMHVLLPYDDSNYGRAVAFHKELIQRALELGGTATGEHGVGIGKVGYMRQEHGPALDVMRSIKQTLDPNNILNPGKIFPGERTSS